MVNLYDVYLLFNAGNIKFAIYKLNTIKNDFSSLEYGQNLMRINKRFIKFLTILCNTSIYNYYYYTYIMINVNNYFTNNENFIYDNSFNKYTCITQL